MQKILFIFLGIILLVFCYQLRYGSGGYINASRVIEQINKQTVVNHALEERNSLTAIQIAILKGSTDSLEQRSRLEFDMTKSGETLVILPNNISRVEK